MELVGRITKDAVVNQLKDERKVVNFSIAVNDYYKTKNSEVGRKISTFVNCSYWNSSKIAECLKKGSLVEISGRIYINAYTGLNGDAKASLNFHVNSIKIHLFGKKETTEQEESPENISGKQKEIKEDLPF